MKDRLFYLLAKYKKHYQIKIFDFIPLDNHFHILLRASSAENLGNFMRTVNSQLARYINRHFNRDSQAIRERYTSRLITNRQYLLDVMKYIWLNRYKVNRNLKPDRDPNCSAFWRINKPYRIINSPTTKADKINNLLAGLLDDYSDLREIHIDEEVSFIRKLMEEGMQKLNYLFNELIKNNHTIGDAAALAFRKQYFSSLRRLHDPPLKL